MQPPILQGFLNKYHPLTGRLQNAPSTISPQPQALQPHIAHCIFNFIFHTHLWDSPANCLKSHTKWKLCVCTHFLSHFQNPLKAKKVTSAPGVGSEAFPVFTSQDAYHNGAHYITLKWLVLKHIYSHSSKGHTYLYKSLWCLCCPMIQQQLFSNCSYSEYHLHLVPHNCSPIPSQNIENGYYHSANNPPQGS